MKVWFRVDSSTRIGTGHLMRCLTLADSLRGFGADITFVCRELPGAISSLVEKCNFSIHRLPPPAPTVQTAAKDEGHVTHAGWLGVPWHLDAQQTENLLAYSREGVDWLVVDHYGLDHRWESRMRAYAKRIMVIDDVADRRHDYDLLLDQTFSPDQGTRYLELVPRSASQLLGPRYALLRPEFAQVKGKVRTRDGSVRRILVFFGGTDYADETRKVLGALGSLSLPGITVDVVVGMSNPNCAQVEQICRSMPNTVFHCQVDGMAELMARADFSVGAGGMATWERCCTGLPSMVVTLAQNQEPLARALAQAGIILYAGPNTTVTPDSLRNAISTFMGFPNLLSSQSKKASELVDGRGTERVVRWLVGRNMRLRPACAADAKNVFSWRNAEETRRYSFNPTAISASNHSQWFDAALRDPNRALLIAECDGEAVGVLRYDLNGDRATVSLYTVPGKQGQGHGSQMLRSGGEWLLRNHPRIHFVFAEVRADNCPSVRAFQNAGFEHHISIFRRNQVHES